MMVIGYLNIRGGRSSAKRRGINNIILKCNVDFFFIHETKLVNISVSMAGSFWRNKNIEFSYTMYVGASGGILSLWNSDSVQVISSFGGKGYLGVKAIWKEETYYIVNVYSLCSLTVKRLLLGNLISSKSKFMDDEWIIGGEFNAIKCRGKERSFSYEF